MSINYKARAEALLLKRDVTPSAYQKGFEDYRYLAVYRNPFALGSREWRDYCQGNEDARAEQRRERI